MDRAERRSRNVNATGTMTATSPTAIEVSWERFEALYRSSRDDVYAYVATLLREPGPRSPWQIRASPRSRRARCAPRTGQ
ncbi:MAG TPA: hypothetical protein VFG31_02345, partial [Conexibacter sp.]|nr:hypothetical protein [Conexibacter sp.]